MIGSRAAIWITAQVHLLFAAFVLGVPMFAVVAEAIGMWGGEKRYDKLAKEFTRLLLVAYSAGLGLPFLLSALALGSFLRWFKRYRPFIPVVERGAGVLLVVVGVLVFTNYYVILNSWAISLTPEWLLRRL